MKIFSSGRSPVGAGPYINWKQLKKPRRDRRPATTYIKKTVLTEDILKDILH